MRRALPLLLLALVACGDKATPRAGETGGSTSAPPAASLAPDGVVLRVSYEGGLLPSHHVAGAPAWTLYGDGRFVGHGPQITIYPGPAYPNLQLWQASGEAVRWLAERAREAGIDGQRRDYGQPPVADAASTVFHLSDERGTHDVSVYALAEASGTGLTAEQAANRARLTDLLGLLGDPGRWPGSPTESAPYVADTVAVLARPYEHDGSNPSGTPQEIAWRGPDPASGRDVRGNRCLLVTGDALTAAMPDFRRSNTLTRWTYGGTAWTFVLRPLLPDEKDCPA